MAKKIILTALVGVLLSVFAGSASAYGGKHNGGGRYGGGFYRPDYHRNYCDRRVHRRGPVAVYPSRGLFIRPFIIISFR